MKNELFGVDDVNVISVMVSLERKNIGLKAT